MKKKLTILILAVLCQSTILAQSTVKDSTLTIRVNNGKLAGKRLPSGVGVYKGVPFAKPPVGDLRWKEPQPADNWEGLRMADQFGNKALQKPIFGDMGFRAPASSEDCLYLNVWTPAINANAKLPVMVYFYGGGLVAGDGSEPRYDGESMARKGIVALTVNYRLGIFGFFSHPDLSAESDYQGSGNYGYMDQLAALKWVKENIAAFGGDPDRVTIAGESAGSISVFAQMASPLSKGLFAGAIGESGAAIYPTLAPVPLREAEDKGKALAQKAGVSTISELRNIPGETLLDIAFKNNMGGAVTTIDGKFFTELPVKTFTEGRQAQVPLLLGWNSAEIAYNGILKNAEPTPGNYIDALRQLYDEKSAEVLRLYPAANNDEVVSSATALASDRFIVYSTWKWADLHSRTSKQPIYRYLFSKTKPPMTADMENAVPGLAGGITKNSGPTKKSVSPVGAPHAFEIEYALGNLLNNQVYEWTDADHQLSETMLTYFANFIKRGNPNNKVLPAWPELKANGQINYINLDVFTRAEREKNTERYLFLDKEYTKQNF